VDDADALIRVLLCSVKCFSGLVSGEHQPAHEPAHRIDLVGEASDWRWLRGALQRASLEREGEPLSVRVGLNTDEPIEEKGDLFGAMVILASPIAARADVLTGPSLRALGV